jgi:hypothetical protein
VTFLSPLFLLGLGALALPIVLHLLRRREGRTLEFPALRYLRQTTREQARTIRFRQLLLLAVRLGILVLLVLAGARLLLPVGRGEHPPAELVLVVDNGLTSSAVVGERRILDELVALGLEALERTGPRDRVRILAAGEPWLPALPLTPDEAAERLRGLEPTHGAPDLTQAVERARALLRTTGSEPAQIILLSNLDRGLASPDASPRPDLDGEPPGPRVVVVSPELALPPNRAVVEIEAGSGLVPRAGDPVVLQLLAAGSVEEGLPFRTFLDDDLVGAGRIGADGMGSVLVPPLSPGWSAVRVELEPDALRADDVRRLSLRVEPAPGVGVLGSVPSFLEDALVVLEEGGRLFRTVARQADLILVGEGSGDLPETEGRTVVILAPESPELLPGLNRVLGALRPGWRLEIPPGTPSSRGLEVMDPRLRLPGEPRIRTAYRLVSGEGAAAGVLVSLSDGSPWLVEAPSADRSVLVLLSPLTAEAGDVPTSAAMIPLVDFLTSGTGAWTGPVEVRAGEPLPVPAGGRALRTPEGAVLPLDGAPTFAATGRAGIYEFLDGDGGLVSRVAVNPVPFEGAGVMEAREGAARLGPDALGIPGRGSWTRAVLADRRGREAWQPLAALALLLLLVEGWFAGTGGLRTRPSSPESGGPGP